MVEELLGLNDSEADYSTQEEKSPNPKKKKRQKSSKNLKRIQRNHIASKKIKYLNFGRPLMT